MSEDYISRIHRMYDTYAPERKAKLPALLTQNAGRESEMLQKLVEKYGPEPVTAPVVAPPTQVSPQKSQSPQTPPPPGPASPPKVSISIPQSSSPASPGVPSSPQIGAGTVDPMRDLRIQLREDCGFLTREHEIMWEEAWKGRMPLDTYRKTWDLTRAVLLSGVGNKLSSHSRPIRRWQKRFFVLAPPFLYYFNSDQPTAVCKGALYLDRATILEDHFENRKGIQIVSRVTKKPLELDSKLWKGDPSFILNFDTDRLQGTWLEMLKNVAQIGDVGGAAKSFGAYPMSGQSMLNTMMSTGSPMGSPMAAAFTVPGSPVGSQQAAVTMMMMAGADRPMQAPPGMSQAQFQQQQMRQLNDIGVTPQLIAAAQGNNRALGTHPLFNNFAVDAPEIKRRITRLARDRDPVMMAEVFLQFVQDHFDNAPLLWKLMASLEEVEPFTGPTYSHAQMQLNSMSGYGGMYGGGGGGYQAHGMTSQHALINMHRQLFGSKPEVPSTAPNQVSEQWQGQGNTLSGPSMPPTYIQDQSQLNSRLLSDQYQYQRPASAMMRAATGQPLPYSSDNNHLSYSSRPSSPTRGLNISQGSASYGPTMNSTLAVDDGDWQRRIGRIRDRKHLVERLMRELPPQ